MPVTFLLPSMMGATMGATAVPNLPLRASKQAL